MKYQRGIISKTRKVKGCHCTRKILSVLRNDFLFFFLNSGSLSSQKKYCCKKSLTNILANKGRLAASFGFVSFVIEFRLMNYNSGYCSAFICIETSTFQYVAILLVICLEHLFFWRKFIIIVQDQYLSKFPEQVAPKISIVFLPDTDWSFQVLAQVPYLS